MVGRVRTMSLPFPGLCRDMYQKRFWYISGHKGPQKKGDYNATHDSLVFSLQNYFLYFWPGAIQSEHPHKQCSPLYGAESARVRLQAQWQQGRSLFIGRNPTKGITRSLDRLLPFFIFFPPTIKNFKFWGERIKFNC